MRMILPLMLAILSGCSAVDASGPEMAAIHVAIADALLEARRPPDLPNDFEDKLDPESGNQKRRGSPPTAHDADSPALFSDGYCPRLIVFTAPGWCEPCRKLDKEIERVKNTTINGDKPWRGLIGKGDDNAIEIVDASDTDGPEMTRAKQAGVTTWPTVIKIDRNGNESSRTSGVLTAERLMQYQAGRWQPAKPKSTTSTGLNSGFGLHAHRCPTCSFEWSHHGGSAGDVVDHTCVKCGQVVWEIAYWGPVR